MRARTTVCSCSAFCLASPIWGAWTRRWRCRVMRRRGFGCRRVRSGSPDARRASIHASPLVAGGSSAARGCRSSTRIERRRRCWRRETRCVSSRTGYARTSCPPSAGRRLVRLKPDTTTVGKAGHSGRSITVLRAGLFTTIQDSGRWGHQASGVPVSGPMDLVSHRIANALVGNDRTAASLEATLVGPEIRIETGALRRRRRRRPRCAHRRPGDSVASTGAMPARQCASLR